MQAGSGGGDGTEDEHVAVSPGKCAFAVNLQHLPGWDREVHPPQPEGQPRPGHRNQCGVQAPTLRLAHPTKRGAGPTPSEATVPITVSPRVMMASSPYRSAMWWACHGVPPLPRSAITGPTISIKMSTAPRAMNTPTVVCASSSAIQPSCATLMVTAYVWQARRRGGSWRAARRHRKIIDTRITTKASAVTGF